MRLGRYVFKKITKDIDWGEEKVYLEFSHKYWYLYNIYFKFFSVRFALEICRTDWNKDYKNQCASYSPKCKHNMDCNACSDCFKPKNMIKEIIVTRENFQRYSACSLEASIEYRKQDLNLPMEEHLDWLFDKISSVFYDDTFRPDLKR